MKQYKILAPALLRWGISIVFLWFGITQLTNPSWGLPWLHPFIHHAIPVQPTVLIAAHGLVEIILGALLLIGIKTRIVATLLALNLATIILTVGYNDISVRDFGLLIACVSIALHDNDEYCP